jgi:hypothetical protein
LRQQARQAACPTYRQERTKEGSERETGAKEVTMRKTHNFELSKTILTLFLLKLQAVIAFFKKILPFQNGILVAFVQLVLEEGHG